MDFRNSETAQIERKCMINNDAMNILIKNFYPYFGLAPFFGLEVELIKRYVYSNFDRHC